MCSVKRRSLVQRGSEMFFLMLCLKVQNGDKKIRHRKEKNTLGEISRLRQFHILTLCLSLSLTRTHAGSRTLSLADLRYRYTFPTLSPFLFHHFVFSLSYLVSLSHFLFLFFFHSISFSFSPSLLPWFPIRAAQPSSHNTLFQQRFPSSSHTLFSHSLSL